MNKAAIPLIIFLLLAGLFLVVLQKINKGEYNPRHIPTEFIGEQIPALDMPNLLDKNDRVLTSDYQGKVWLLNVWGSWCAQCWKEHAYLMHLSKQGVPIVGINWKDEEAEALRMLQGEGNPFTEIGFDPKSEAVIELGVYGAPETFLIDAEGLIRVKHTGPMTPQVWQQQFQSYFKP